MAEDSKRASSQDLLKSLEKYGVDHCSFTVRRKLISAGLLARRPHKKEKTTAVRTKKRLQWARKTKSQIEDDYSKVNKSVQKVLGMSEVNILTVYIKQNYTVCLSLHFPAVIPTLISIQQLHLWAYRELLHFRSVFLMSPYSPFRKKITIIFGELQMRNFIRFV